MKNIDNTAFNSNPFMGREALPSLTPAEAKALVLELDSKKRHITIDEMVSYEPDEDFYRSMSIEEFRTKMHERIHEMYKLPR
jgi:hypothetical protein